MQNTLTIRKVESDSDLRAFIEFPWKLYKGEPNWIPPLLSMRRATFDKAKNSDWKYMDGEYFAAWRGDQMVGTIAPYINHRHNKTANEHIGWFGAFDVCDDHEAAHALLNTAAEWVQARGYDAIVGPETFSAKGDCGVLVDGFTRPVLLMPYNYPYYERLVLGAGFHKKEDLYSFHLSAQQARESGLQDRLQQVISAVSEPHQITVRPIDRHRLHEEFELFKAIYVAAWRDTWGYFPMTEAELNGLVKMLGRFFDPDFAFFAYVKDEPVGFVMGIPDFNQVLEKAQPRPGVPEWITLLRALWHWKYRPTMTWLRVAMLGVKAEHRRKGIAVALYGSLVERCLNHSRIQHADAGWVSENNEPMLAIARSVGLERYKTHRLYEKRFKEASESLSPAAD